MIPGWGQETQRNLQQRLLTAHKHTPNSLGVRGRAGDARHGQGQGSLNLTRYKCKKGPNTGYDAKNKTKERKGGETGSEINWLPREDARDPTCGHLENKRVRGKNPHVPGSLHRALSEHRFLSIAVQPLKEG